jgi:PAS domain S-box-containing protein
MGGSVKDRNTSITFIVALVIVISTTAILLVFGCIYYSQSKNYQISQARSNLVEDADAMSESLRLPVWNLDEDQVETIMQGAFKNRTIVLVVLESDVFSTHVSRNEEELPDDVLVETRPIVYKDKELGTLSVYANLHEIFRRLRSDIAYFSIMIALLEFLLVATLFSLLRIVILKPISELERFTRSIEKGERLQIQERAFGFIGELASLRRSLEKMLSLLDLRYMELQKALVELEENSNFMQSILQNIPDMVFVKNASDLAFVEMNKAGQELLGLSIEELRGKKDTDFFSEEQAKFFMKKDWDTLAGNTVVEVLQEKIFTKHKGERFLHTKKIPILDKDGKPKYLLGISEDITEKIDREKELAELNASLEGRVQQRTAALKNLNSELETFSYSVSHDLRTPLRAIDGFAQMLLMDYGSLLDSEGNRRLHVIISNVKKMDQIISGLLSLARLSKSSIHRGLIDMEDLARQVSHDQIALLSAGDMEVHIGKLPPIWGDEVLLRQVFTNLISNAIKYSSKSTLRKIEIEGKEEKGFNTYSVRDYGAGFEQEYSDKLFNAFQRLHKTEDFAGIGIGLAIVRSIVERHGGSVRAEGKPGQGACFYFSLPLIWVMS